MAFGLQTKDSNNSITARYDDSVYAPVFLLDVQLPVRTSPSWLTIPDSAFKYLVITTPENYNDSQHIVLINKFNMAGVTMLPDLEGMRVNAWLKDYAIWLYVICDVAGGFSYIQRTCRVTVCKI